MKAASLAAANDIKVYCIGAGTNGVAPVPVRDPFTNRIVLRGMNVEIDEQTLKQIATETGGQYFRATDVEALANIYRQIDQLERTEVEELHTSIMTSILPGLWSPASHCWHSPC